MGKKACLLISQLPTQKVFVLKWSNEKNTSSDSQISTHKVFILEQSNETISPLTTSLFSNGLMKKGCLLIHNSPLAKVFILGWSNEKRMSSDNSPLIMSLFSNDLIKKNGCLNPDSQLSTHKVFTCGQSNDKSMSSHSQLFTRKVFILERSNPWCMCVCVHLKGSCLEVCGLNCLQSLLLSFACGVSNKGVKFVFCTAHWALFISKICAL